MIGEGQDEKTRSHNVQITGLGIQWSMFEQFVLGGALEEQRSHAASPGLYVGSWRGGLVAPGPDYGIVSS